MSKETMVIVLGLLTALMPYQIGIPGQWKQYFYIVAGVIIAGVAFVIRQERIWKEREMQQEQKTNTFAESAGSRPPTVRV
jgi:hypothetical protein